MVNADALVVKLNSGEYKTIHLSSIRPPRNEGEVGADLSVCLYTFTQRCAALEGGGGGGGAVGWDGGTLTWASQWPHTARPVN